MWLCVCKEPIYSLVAKEAEISPIAIIINLSTSQSRLGWPLFPLFKQGVSRTGMTSLNAFGSLSFLSWSLFLSIYPKRLQRAVLATRRVVRPGMTSVLFSSSANTSWPFTCAGPWLWPGRRACLISRWARFSAGLTRPDAQVGAPGLRWSSQREGRNHGINTAAWGVFDSDSTSFTSGGASSWFPRKQHCS